MQRKHQRVRTKRLLPTRQIADILPALLRWHDGEENPLREGVERVDEFELGISAQSDELVHALEMSGDCRKSSHELVES